MEEDRSTTRTGYGQAPPFPISKAVNVSTLENNVKCVVGGPLCNSGLPFGHSVLCGDRSGGVTLRNVISGNTRKLVAHSYHGHNTAVSSCSGSLPSCGGMVSAVTCAEVVIAPDDGSPTLWIGCADGSVQVYFLGGEKRKPTTSPSRMRTTPSRGGRNRNNQSPKSSSASAAGGGGEDAKSTTSTVRTQQQQQSSSSSSPMVQPAGNISALGDDILLGNNNNSPSSSCRHCGSSPPSRTTPVRSSGGGNRVQSSSASRISVRSSATTTANTRRTFGGGGVAAAVTRASYNNNTNNNNNNNNNFLLSSLSAEGGGVGGRRGSPNRQNNNNQHLAADQAGSISSDGCVLVFAEKKHQGAVQAFVSAPSISSVFTGGADWHIVRWRTSYPFGVVAVIGRHSRGVRSLSFSPGNPSILLSGADDGVIKMWSSRQRRPTELTGHRGSVLCLEPWYDPLGLYGDVFSIAPTTASVVSAAQHHHNNNATSAAAGGGGGGGVGNFSSAQSTVSFSPSMAAASQSPGSAAGGAGQQQQQKAIGLISAGEDGTMRFWASDSSVANSVTQVSRLPLVRVQVFSDNLVMAFAKDGSATVYSVPSFPEAPFCVYRFDNVGQVQRMLGGGASNNNNKRRNSPGGSSRISSYYLSDVKVLAHINGFLLWSLTTQGARLSLLPVAHFEAATKKQLATVGERREEIEALIAETLDDADSTQSGQLLFQRIMTGAGGDGGEGGGGKNSFLQQLAKLHQQNSEKPPVMGTSSTAGGGGAGGGDGGWHFDPSEADYDLDPGQLSAAETSASSLRGMVRTVNSALGEMSRLVAEFHGKKIDLQMQSFSKVMEKKKTQAADYFKKEFESLESKKKEIVSAERDLQHQKQELKSATSAAAASSSAAAAAEKESSKEKESAASKEKESAKPKVNIRKQIGDLLSEMFSGKRQPIATRSVLGGPSSPTTTTTASTSSSSSSPSESNVSLGEEEKRMINGIQGSVSVEGAASYIFAYCQSKQQGVSQMEEKHKVVAADMVESSVKKKLEEEIASLKKQLNVSERRCESLEEVIKANTPKKSKTLTTISEEDRKEKVTKNTGNLKPRETAGGGGGSPSSPAGDASPGSPSGRLSGLAAASLVVAVDKKLRRKIKRAEGEKHKSDEDEVANKKDMTQDEVVVTLEGVGTWGGAERKEKATQTKIRTSATFAAQVELIVNNSSSNSSSQQQQQQQETTGKRKNPYLNEEDEAIIARNRDASPPWGEDDIDLMRQSERALGRAEQYRSGRGTLTQDDMLSPEDPSLVETARTVAAAMNQLKELEKQYDVSQRNLVDFEHSALASGLGLNDPRLQHELDRLRSEEKFVAEEMRRLHYLLVSPNSPIPGSAQDPTSFIMSAKRQQQQQRLKSSFDGDRSLLHEFKGLLSKEKTRTTPQNSPSPSYRR